MTTQNNKPQHGETQPESDIIFRSASVSTSTLDEKTRSIECVMCTESAVRMFDWDNYEYFDEVLLSDGARMGDQMVLLNNHSRWSSKDVLGSVRSMRQAGTQWIGRMHFVEGDDEVERVYQRYKQGHMRDVSIGYSYQRGDFVRIPKGQSAEINGRKFTASDDRPMRVVTKWEGRELSATPIGADQLAKTRSIADCKFGHRESINENDTRSLSDMQPNERDLKNMSATATNPATETKTPEQTAAGTEGVRSETTNTAVNKPTEAPKIDEEKIRQDAEKAVLERVNYARSFVSQGVRAELIDEAIREGWTKETMNERFLQSLTSGRSEPVGNRAPAGHIVDNERTSEDIQTLFLMRGGVSLENGRFASDYHRGMFMRHEGDPRDMSFAVRTAETLDRGGNLDQRSEKALDFAYRHRSIHLVQLCRMALDFKNVRYDSYSEWDIVTRMLTTQSVVPFLQNALGAMILDAFVGTPDTTGWCQVEMLPNDNPQPVVKGGMGSRLKKRLSGQTPEPMTREATEEYLSVATYSEQYFTDRKDLLADRFGRIGEGPQELGSAAMDLIQDLVYSGVLLNPTMTDTNALYSVAHGNLATNAPLGPETLAARKTAMATQANNGRLFSCIPGILLVPESQSHYADELLGSSEKRDNTSNKVYGTKNWAQGKYTVVSEPRLDVGCVNPDTETLVAGRPSDYYLIERTGRYGYKKAFLKSNNGAPIIENWMPGDGRIGVGTTVELEAGFKPVAWEGIQCGTGAGSR